MAAKSKKSSGFSPEDPIAARIRKRRAELGLSLQELARTVGVRAPSFVYYIERGGRIPSPDLAARIAEALGEDVQLYRAWAEARRRNDLATTLRATRRLELFLGASQQPSHGVPPPIERAEPAARLHPRAESLPGMTVGVSVLRRLQPNLAPHRVPQTPGGGEAAAPVETSAPTALMLIPLIPEGADPGLGPSPEVEVPETLRVDPRLLPPGEPLFRPFAYRLSAEGARGAAPWIRPGDLVIVTRNAWPLLEGQIYAVRRAGRVALNRARRKAGGPWLEGVEGSGAPAPSLVGRVAVVIRSGRGEPGP